MARGLRALELLASAPQSASAVGVSLGVNRSTALRLLQELELEGFVVRGDDKRFSVVPGRLATLMPNQASDVCEVASRRARAFTEEIHESTNVSVPSGTNMVYIAYAPSPQALTVREHLGTLRPMHCSAIGRAYLAALSSQRRGPLLQKLDLTGGTDRAPKSRRELARRVDVTRERGWAMDEGETVEGVTCVAVAIGEREPVAAVGVSAPSSRLTGRGLDAVLEGLIDAFADMRPAHR